MVQENITSCASLFYYAGTVTFDSFRQEFPPTALSPDGSNNRHKEVAALAFWHDYLIDIKGTHMNVEKMKQLSVTMNKLSDKSLVHV